VIRERELDLEVGGGSMFCMSVNSVLLACGIMSLLG